MTDDPEEKPSRQIPEVDRQSARLYIGQPPGIIDGGYASWHHDTRKGSA
jgi:hypothetical protein